MSPRITEARHVRGYVLELVFAPPRGDAPGERAELDLRDMIVGQGGLLAELEDVDVFCQVRVDHEAGTVAWPNGVDFCPVVLYSRATGKPIPEPDAAPSRV